MRITMMAEITLLKINKFEKGLLELIVLSCLLENQSTCESLDRNDKSLRSKLSSKVSFHNREKSKLAI